MRKIIVIALCLLSIFGKAQLMQTNSTPGGYKFTALKADTMLIHPFTVDTPNIGNTKFGTSTAGAIHVQKIGVDSAIIWVRSAVRWVRVGSIGGGGSGTVTSVATNDNTGIKGGTITNTGTLYIDTTIISTKGNVRKVADSLAALIVGGTAIPSNTGALTYGGIAVASGTTVNIGAVTGVIVDNETNPSNPSYQLVNYAGATGITVPTIATGTGTYVLLNSSGALVFQNTFPTTAQRKSMIYLSKISHPNLTSISFAIDEVDFVTSPLQQFRDLFQFIQYMKTGIVATGNAGLTINTSNGEILGNGINFVTSRTVPNNITIAAGAPRNFLLLNQSGATGGFVTAIDPANYDVGGVTTAVGGGTNRATIQYLYYAPGVGFAIQRGQTVYANLTDAIAAVGRESFTVRANLVNNSILIAAIVLRHTTTDMSDPAFVRILTSDKFGQIGGAAAGISVTTLQTAYNNSVVPQITTNVANDGVTIRRGSASDADAILKGQDGSGADNFTLLGNGNIGLKTNAPTHTMTYGNTSTGIAMYNTADQTNFARARQYWNGNVYTIATERGGTESLMRSISINADGRILTLTAATAPTTGVLSLNYASTVANGSGIGITGQISTSSGVSNGYSFLQTINQSGTAGYRGLWISPFEQSLGGGPKLLIDAGTNNQANGGGTHTSKFTVSSTGATVINGNLTVNSTTQASTPSPTMTATQIAAISSPTEGSRAYDLTNHYPVFYNGSAWSDYVGGSAWGLNGNASTTSNFIGTTNNISMRFRTNNLQRMIIDSVGYVGIGQTAPRNNLHIYNNDSSIIRLGTNDNGRQTMYFMESDNNRPNLWGYAIEHDGATDKFSIANIANGVRSDFLQYSLANNISLLKNTAITGTFSNTGTASLGGNTTINGTLSAAGRFGVNNSVALDIQANQQSAISSWWGLQLNGMLQSNPMAYNSSNAGGGNNVAHVVTRMSNTTSHGFLIAGAASQTGNYFVVQSSSGTADVFNIKSNGNVVIGSNTSTTSNAGLELATKGLLPARVTAAMASALSLSANDEGIIYYITTTNATFTSKGWWGYNGSTWEKLNN